MMDELKLSLSTKLMKGIVSKLLSRLVQKKLGYKINIQLNGVNVEMKDEKIHLHIDADADLNKDDFTSSINNIGLK